MNFQTISEKYLHYDGRLNRKKYISRYLMLFLIEIVIITLAASTPHPISKVLGDSIIIVFLLFIVPKLFLSIRRLHDLNKPTWWIVFTFVPLLNIFTVIYLNFFKGTTGPNKYGDDPLEKANNAIQSL